ncbi:MAG: hydrogenase maturation protease [Victivallales bacterium]|nr:hydrogenase maturation protease [Victivallales bacterium]MCF7889377.1 hydrogenase maturation protease [Victivallales bacterium]
MSNILLIGYGNPGRLDDGLGPALAELFNNGNYPNLTVESNYQLTVEDAIEISKHDTVIFADADVSCSKPFYFKKIEPAEEIKFSSHSITPENLIGLTLKLFNRKPEAYILGIRGYDFNSYSEALSEQAEANLFKAANFLKYCIKKNTV